MDLGRSRRASASGVVAIMVTIMVVATAASGAIIYYGRGGSGPALNADLPSGSNPSGSASDAQLANLTSAIGGLSGPTTSNFTTALGELSGNLSLPVLANLTSSSGGLPRELSNTTLVNFTTAAEQFVANDSSLPAEDFTTSGTTYGFACVASPSGAHLAFTNDGTASAHVVSVSIASVGGVAEFAPSSACDIAAGSGVTTYITFPATTHVSPSSVPGQVYAGVVSLSDGSLIPFSGAWQ
ncbi:MAG TPA: hypothetical protein VGS04_05840 [Nitrososphaerales archaeon]|nr:hypothetical protein [Nitrososphaerales archaeon]